MPKRILTGKVTSNKSDKTITVIVDRKIMNPMYKKFVTKSKNGQKVQNLHGGVKNLRTTHAEPVYSHFCRIDVSCRPHSCDSMQMSSARKAFVRRTK